MDAVLWFEYICDKFVSYLHQVIGDVAVVYICQTCSLYSDNIQVKWYVWK